MKLYSNQHLAELLAKSVWTELELTVRAFNSLDAANIRTLRELVTKEEKHLLEDNNFVPTSVNEIKEQLAKLGLTLGMSLEDILSDIDEGWDINDENISKLLREMKLPPV